MYLHLVLLLSVTICSTKADIWDDAARIVEELQEIANRAQSTAFAQTAVLDQHVWTFAGNATNDGQAAVEDARVIISAQLDNLGILAEALNRIQCLEDRQEELQQISDDVNFGIYDCIMWLKIGAGATVSNVSAYIYDTQYQVTLFRVRMEQCPRQSEDVQCILEIIGEMELAKEALPAIVLDEVLRVMLLVRSWENAMLACADNRVGLVFTEGNRIVLEVEQCLTAPDRS